MTTYKEFQSELEKLHRQAESARLKEKAGALAQIKALIVEYQLLPSDFGFTTTRQRKASPAAAKYRNPETYLALPRAAILIAFWRPFWRTHLIKSFQRRLKS